MFYEWGAPQFNGGEFGGHDGEIDLLDYPRGEIGGGEEGGGC